MLERLAKFTGPKIVKPLEAKLKAIVADKKNQEVSFELEKQRVARLQKCIDNCIIRAPSEGIIVYANQTNAGDGSTANRTGCDRPPGPVDLPALRPQNMRVKTRINETKVGLIKAGQEATSRSMLPRAALPRAVDEVTAISTPMNGPFSDVRIYFAMVNITEGFTDLAPG